MQNFDPNRKCYIERIEAKNELDKAELKIDANISNTTRVLAILSLLFSFLGGLLFILNIFFENLPHLQMFVIVLGYIFEIAAIPLTVVGLVKDKERKYTAFYIIAIVVIHIWFIFMIVKVL